ncbi:MAG TPA: hypothetical protein VN836_05250 [Verrucomicrobiae bacterium]|nr:hypothetical protein [Verrucomicrobiae bacterium]
MKIGISIALAALAVSLTSCATSRPPQTFHNTDNNAVVIDSLDQKTGQMLQPAATVREDSNMFLAKAANLSKRQTTVVTVENYNESQPSLQYHIRGTQWFIGVQSLGNEHIVSVQDKGVPNPEGLITLTEYF